MPDEAITDNEVQTALDKLTGKLTNPLDNPKVRQQNYQLLLNAIQNDELDIESVNNLLKVCVQDISATKYYYATTIIKIILAILVKIKNGKYGPAPDMTPTALALISMIKTLATLTRVESLLTLSFDTLLEYPEDTLIAVAEHTNDILEVFILYYNVDIKRSIHHSQQACNLLLKLLKILPPEKKRVFVENGVSIWFSKIIPYHMSHITSSPLNTTQMTLEVLELLTEELVHIDYTHVPQWHAILKCICNTEQYPVILKNLLLSENEAWQRLWIVFIKLLKHQITQSQGAVGTPINSMLPVVETAFKMDVKNRCKAFECWNVLIDSFSTETNESNINKRIKLLIIPLKSNNAKHEDTALAKFKCWWHLIRKFQNKMDKFLDIVLISILNFCFGRYNDVEKTNQAPGQISATLKSHCDQAIVDIIGHVNCGGCTELPQLKGKLINPKRLVDNWNHWIYSLTFVIMKTAKCDSGLTKQQMKCVWKSFLMTIGELPENNIRKDLFSEILSLVNRFVQECKSNNWFLDVAFNILILSLFDEDTKIKQLFKSDNDATDPMVQIVNTILNSSLNGYYQSLPPTDLMAKLKPVTKLIVDEEVCTSKHIINRLLHSFPTNDVALMLWNELAEALRDSEHGKCIHVTFNMLMWPLKAMQKFTEVKIPAITWYTMYIETYTNLNKTEIDKEISDILLSTPDAPISNVYFKLCVVLAVLKHKFTEDNCGMYEKEINQLLNLTKMMDSYKHFEQILPILVDRIVAIMTVVTTKVNDTIAALILGCVKYTLQVLTQACKQQTADSQILLLIGSLLRPLESIFAVESYFKLISEMIQHLVKCSPVLCTDPSTERIIISVMKTALSRTPTTDTNYNTIKAFIEVFENNATKKKLDPSSPNNKFPTPQTKEVPKRVKKKEASIVNTVVENGEEYVVVKSNWKFNPRKLTENQKEKLQRKREDIPALYQDLSQSQDEFKLVTWKTDSQDTTSSSRSESKSNKPGDNDTVAEILKSIPNTDVVPKILDSFLSDNERKREESNTKDSVTAKDNLSIKNVSTPSPKSAKSPRMALKDRVFRNVRNLMESSGLQKENKETKEEPNNTESILKTPTNSKNNNSAHLVNSAPPLLSADRPSRVKRKPKKFEDLALLTTKKRRFSQYDSQKQHSSDSGHESNEQNDDNIDAIQSASENKEKTNDLSETNNVVCQAIDNKEVDETMQKTDAERNKIIKNREGTGSTKVSSPETANVDDEKLVVKPSEQSVKVVTNIDPTMDVDKPFIDKTSKTITEVHAPVLATNKHEEVPTTKVSKDLKALATPKMTRASSKEILNVTSTMTKDVATPKASLMKEVLTPKTNKVDKEVATPKKSETVNESAPSASNVNNGASTPKNSKDKVVATPQAQDKEISTPKTTKATKKNSLIATKAGKETASPKVIVEPIPVIPKELKEVFTAKAKDLKVIIGKDDSIPNISKTTPKHNEESACNVTKEVNEPSTREIPKEAKIVSSPNKSNIKEISSSSKLSKDIAKTTIPKDGKIAPKFLENVMVVLSNDINKDNHDLSTPKNISELATSKAAKVIRETRSSKSPKDLKEDISNDLLIISKDVSPLKQSPITEEKKSTTKKVKKSRIEKELAIDMVEGHPFLKNNEKRLTRKTLEYSATGRRKSLAEKLNKSKSETNSTKKTKNKNKDGENTTASMVVDESQEKDSEPKENTSSSDELPYSDDVIESSQDSTITTISVKSTRKTPKKVAVVCVEKMSKPSSKVVDMDSSQSILEPPTVNICKPSMANNESKDDSVLPLNKTAVGEFTQANLTENMDTEPIDDNDVILVNADVPATTVSASEDTIIGPETQEISEADTQPTDPKDFMDTTVENIPETSPEKSSTSVATHIVDISNIDNDLNITENRNQTDKTMDLVDSTANNTTVPLMDSVRAEIEQSNGVSSPFKDEAQRQQDFLNNTIEISPIKTMSPERHKKSPSPETSSDYVVIKLTSPVHSNGEPFEKCSSPEVFTEDKVSPDKRDLSPPRVETNAVVTSPSSSLSLKKNRPQVRSGGRAAQMLGLCVPDRVQAIVNPERSESDEVKKSSSTNTPARRNLRILYISVNDNPENNSSNNTSENDDSENFLKFKRTLPTVDSSPSGPILKRKLADIADDATVSPASKRKRVSFHDPPVSTTISVQKYIEPIGVRSPQNSAQKRLERQMRQHTPKSPKRLENVFKLDTVLTKTVESFSDSEVILIPEEEQCSLDETPVVEIVRASELNDADPICPELLDCKDPISNIAGELSSSAMKSLLIKELEGKIETVGDLAKMTELEVNRLCIKAPKVKVAKKVLTEYTSKRIVSAEPVISDTINAAEFDEPMTESEPKVKDMEVQTHKDEMDVEMQTMAVPTRVFSVQTEKVPIAHTSMQTNESGSKSTADIIKSCLVEKPDFVNQLSDQLEESSIQQLSEKLPQTAITDLLMKKITPSNTKDVLDRIFENNSTSNDRSKELPFIRDYLCGRFSSKDLVLLCSQILKIVHDRPT